MDNIFTEDELRAGTGFMGSLSESLQVLVEQGYTENFTPKRDHLECCSGKYKFFPEDIRVDEMLRFENTSDPDDQSIIYAISSVSQGIKGIYVESYGIYQDDLSYEMLQRLKDHRH